MVFVLFCCRGDCQLTSQKERVSHMFALREKKCYCLVGRYCCLLSQKKIWLDYVDIYYALLLVDYWGNSEKHVSVVSLRVFFC